MMLWTDVLKKSPNHSLANYWMGNAYRDKKNIPKAIEYYEKTIQLVPWQADPYYQLGVIYSRMGKKQEAKKYLKKAIDANPKFLEAQRYLKGMR